jgi:pimeloyl-ACP methyl ester carboxylesterase
MSAEAELPEPFDPDVDIHDVLGTRIGTTTEGPDGAKTLLLLHGVPGGVRDYRYLAPLLSGRLRIHRLELPGYGTVRDATWHDYSPDGRARLVIAAADALGVSRFAIAGHSMGGPAAIATAAMLPHRVTGLVAIASVGVSRHRGMLLPGAGARALREALLVPILRDAVVARSRDMYRRMRFPTAETLTREDLRVDLANVMEIDFARAKRRAAAVRAPSLVAFADDDPMVEPAVGHELARTIRDAETAAYPVGGHNIQKSQARDLAERILALLAEP